MTARSRARPRRSWTRYSEDRLLDVRLRDLDLRIENTWIEHGVERLYDELAHRGIGFRPRVWMSTEWFSPDGMPGIAIPFYLAHPHLIRLERKQMLEVEGGTEVAFLRLLRHEAGHAIDAAFRLHFKKAWRDTFGRFSLPYPDAYRPRPNSRAYVVHLDGWYAQAHPAEDFAETFAVWLAPRSNWRQRYRQWPRALKKLRRLDEMMQDHVIDQPPRVPFRRTVDPVSRSNMTLREYYTRKHERYGGGWPSLYDRDLKRLFSSDVRYRGRPSASGFLRKMRIELRTAVAEWTGVHTYTIDQVMSDMIERCRQLKLRVALPDSEARTQAVLLLTVHTLNCLQIGRYEIPV